MSDLSELHVLASRRDPVVQVTTYGVPAAPFHRIVEQLRWDGDVLHVERQVFARGYVKSFDVTVGFVAAVR
jgi:hypothetical protein